MHFKLSNLNSNFCPDPGCLNPALNNLTKHLTRKKDQLFQWLQVFFNISFTTYLKSPKISEEEVAKNLLTSGRQLSGFIVTSNVFSLYELPISDKIQNITDETSIKWFITCFKILHRNILMNQYFHRVPYVHPLLSSLVTRLEHAHSLLVHVFCEVSPEYGSILSNYSLKFGVWPSSSLCFTWVTFTILVAARERVVNLKPFFVCLISCTVAQNLLFGTGPYVSQ